MWGLEESRLNICQNDVFCVCIDMSTSTQSSLLKQLGHYGGERVGAGTHAGKFMAIHALADSTIGAGTVGSISNLNGAVVLAGDVIVGEWTAIEITAGDAIIYYAD